MRLEDICTVFTDGDWIESKDQSEEGIRLVQTGNIGEGTYLEKESRAKYISEETFEQLKCTEIFPGDILVSRLPEPVGRACIIPEKEERMITAVDCTICRPDESVISKEYLCYFMRSNAYYTRLLGSVTGTTRKRISRKNLGNVELVVPSKEEQYSVVEQLDCLVKVIDSRKKEIELLDDLIKARFVELFGDPINNPKNWKKVLFGDVVYYQEGPGVRNWQFRSEGIKLINIKNVVNDSLDLSNTDKYLEVDEVNQKYKHFLLDAGDYVMASSGVTWGKIAEVFDEHLPLCLNTSMIRIRPIDESVLEKEYLRQFIKGDGFRKQIERLITGSAQPNFGPSHLAKVSILVPDIELQCQFSDFCKQVDKSKFAVQKSLEETQTLFDSLMQKYFG